PGEDGRRQHAGEEDERRIRQPEADLQSLGDEARDDDGRDPDEIPVRLDRPPPAAADRLADLLGGGAGDDAHVDVAAQPDHLVQGRAAPQLAPARAERLAEELVRYAERRNVTELILGDAFAGDRRGLAAELLGEAEGARHAIALR